MRRELRVPSLVLIGAAAWCAIAACASASAQQPGGYAIRKSYQLMPDHDRMRGRIELLEDARIRPEMREAITEAYGGDPCADHPPAVLEALCSNPRHTPLRHAMLRLVGADGHVLATRVLERPIAQLGVTSLYASDRRSYMLTVDLSIGMGSYAGPYTRFAEPSPHGFGWLTADSAGVTDTMTMVSTLKTVWKLARRPTDPSAELLMVMCRPDFSAPTDSAAFRVTYERYTFDGTRWHRRGRSEPGCFESDEPFPPLSKFP